MELLVCAGEQPRHRVIGVETDVAIFGGGPAGSTVGALLRKYNPSLRVAIIEREQFPREHVGESQLPAITGVLAEMGVWDKVEAANFPIKIGSTYRWGCTDDLWNLNFLPGPLEEVERPGRYGGQRAFTAFQVDRAIYDKILLDHAAELGCEVRQGWKATHIETKEDRVERVEISSDGGGKAEEVTASYYVDATGVGACLRRAMGVGVTSPSSLRNVAIWDYWTDARWAETIGKAGTRVQVMSLGWGWIWFIPLGETRTSIGLIVPAEHLKSCGREPEQLYSDAIEAEPRIRELTAGAHREMPLRTTRDWSYVADRLAGENWFLAGDSCGFADPILAAGMTLAHVGARRVAYTLLETLRGEIPAEWLRVEFDRKHRASIGQHIRFADYWYSANGCFTDLKAYCSEIAKDAGLDLDADAAFQWLSAGGFTEDMVTDSGPGTAGFGAACALVHHFSNSPATTRITEKNEFRLNLAGAMKDWTSHYTQGRVVRVPCYKRNGKILPLVEINAIVFSVLNRERDAQTVAKTLGNHYRSNPKMFPFPREMQARSLETLEAMIHDGWVTAKVNKKRPFLRTGGA